MAGPGPRGRRPGAPRPARLSPWPSVQAGSGQTSLQERKRAQDNREPGKLTLPGPQLGRLRGGYRLLIIFVRLLRRSCDALRRVRSAALCRLGDAIVDG